MLAIPIPMPLQRSTSSLADGQFVRRIDESSRFVVVVDYRSLCGLGTILRIDTRQEIEE